MRLAITIYDDRVSPLFESATTMLLVDTGERGDECRQECRMDTAEPIERVASLSQLGVDTLVCGGISRFTWYLLESKGISVFPWVAGGIEAVVDLVGLATRKQWKQDNMSELTVAVTARSPQLDGPIDPRFGRCRYFVIVKPDGSVEAVENQNASLGGGAGIQAATSLAEHGVDVLLTGNVGPNAFGTLNVARIEVYTGVSGTVAEAVAAFEAGSLSRTHAPTRAAHYGQGRGGRDG